MIEYHDPEAQVGIEAIPYTLSVAIRAGEPLRVGLLANGFPDSVNFLHSVGEAMQAQVDGMEILAWNKGNASIPANEEMLEDIRGSCQAVVAAYGH